MKPCPKCGKPMVEEPKFPGLWLCPGAKVRLNDVEPPEFECAGMELTEEGSANLLNEVWKAHISRN